MSNDSHQEGDETQDRSFADILKEFETTSRATAKEKDKSRAKGKGRGRSRPGPPPPLKGTVVGISSDFVLVDYGGKSEGMIMSADLLDAEGNLSVKRGDTFDVAITGFKSDGMAKLSRVAGPRRRTGMGCSGLLKTKKLWRAALPDK